MKQAEKKNPTNNKNDSHNLEELHLRRVFGVEWIYRKHSELMKP